MLKEELRKDPGFKNIIEKFIYKKIKRVSGYRGFLN